MRRKRNYQGPEWLLAAGMVLAILPGAARAADSTSPAPKKDTSKSVPPPEFKDRVTLFAGKQADLDQNWQELGSGGPARWKIEDDAIVTNGGDIVTKQKYSDFQLHLEFRVPYMPDEHGQERGNSGVFLQGRYEIQVLDSYGIAEPGRGDCGAVYDQSAPLVNASKPPLQWQTYDITFRAPRRSGNDDSTAEPGRVTIQLNGITIQNNQILKGVTGAAIDNNVYEPGPLRLQFHGNTVAYRNIWIVPLPPRGAQHY